MNNADTIIRILHLDPVANSGTISFIKQNTITDAEAVGNNVIVRGISDRQWVLLYCENREGFNKIKSRIRDDDEFFFAIDKQYFQDLVKGYATGWKLETGRYYLPDTVSLQQPAIEYKQLPANCADYIHENSVYKEFASVGYIKQRLEKGRSAAIMKNGCPVAWAITHDDGAIGFLHVLPGERGKGYAKAVTLAMIELLRKNNELPVVQVEESNIQAVQLIKKIGFVKDRDIIWFQRTKS